MLKPRRLRTNALVRSLTSETQLQLSDFIQPYFIAPQLKTEPILNFDGIHRYSIEDLLKKIETDVERKVKSFLMFGSKNEDCVPEAVLALKKRFGDSILLFTDVCLCPYTQDASCGVTVEGHIDEEKTLIKLSNMAVSHAQAGADFVAPSDMMDGRVGYIRKILDQQGFPETGILSYTAKYASSYYGPFREAMGSTGKPIDRSTYQMDFHNSKEALKEMSLDISEGADILMVKPALAYLDIISQFAKESTLPIAAYSVSGEYQMMKLMAREGLVNEQKFVLENLTAIKRAGAKIIITYSASEIAEKGWLR